MGSQKSIPKTASKNALIIGLGAFFLAIGLSFVSQGILSKIKSILPAILLLMFIILLGILFDIIGTAVTKAAEHPFHAKAATKTFGAKEAVWLTKNADKVASYCNDVVGDISGTLSGAIGVALVVRLTINSADVIEILFNTLMTASIAAVTIGGKAYGKSFALKKAEPIIFKVGKTIAFLQGILTFSYFRGDQKRGK